MVTFVGLVYMIYGAAPSTDTYQINLSKLLKFLFWIPALYNFILEKIFCRKEKEIITTDENGKEYIINNYSSLFFIRNKYWTIILLVIYAFMAFIAHP
ncbi:hypothetical protein ACVRZD_05330 [Streptococcus hongkongensis]